MMLRTLILLMVFLLSVVQADTQKENIDISGNWVLNTKQSSNAQKLIGKSLEFMDYSAAKVVRTSTGPVLLGNYKRKPTPKQIKALYDFFDSIVPLGNVKNITYADPLLTLQYENGKQRQVYTDGRDSAATTQSTAVDNDQKLVFAAWEKQGLIIETNTNSGTNMIERYSIDTKKNALKVEITINSARLPKPLPLKRVYNQVIEE